LKSTIVTNTISKFEQSVVLDWNLHALCNTPDSVLVSLKFGMQHKRRG